MQNTTILILPGWQDSGPKHWQGIWLEKYPNAIKVEQDDWLYTKKEDWVRKLDEYIQKYKDSDIIFVGHSLACATFAFWAQKNPEQNLVKGALLVSPSDMDVHENIPQEITGFSPMPLVPFNCDATVVVSSNDPYVTSERAQFFADSWGAKLVNIGDHGHINVDAGFGEWPEGEKLLQELCS